MTTPLEDNLARARPRLLDLAQQLATGGDRTAAVPPDHLAAGLDSLASYASALACEVRGDEPLR